ncbi:ABC transporter ATP-binding protein [Rhizobium sp. L1K21]|uniref:dipeptide ABC transporter ATP-binding protein n=1 Tax=Rhizobium sp. L1K21 TaxID=2954933 RepID=UPI002092E31A|nr:ABC transporter ATP-binding protein [Rhizobium sp. L1K21]MCO6187648.1 ABC transporter ATP-binding protein [Rhizobium sp. L1K21]
MTTDLASEPILQREHVPVAGRDLLRVENLSIAIKTHKFELNVVKNASFRVPAGKTVALVGESGSGKSIIAQAIMGILPGAARITSGSILFRDPAMDQLEFDHAAERPDGIYMQSMRGSRISMIFQEPMTSLSPIHKVGDQIEEALTLHHKVSRKEARQTTIEMLGRVGFPDPARAYDMYSMELSGGLRQRAMIAMALICRPALLIADEPTTALDVTVQAQVLGLLKRAQQFLNMSMLLITHDLGVVANMADEVVVIYHGNILESGDVRTIFKEPGHPYTRALMAAVPDLATPCDERLKALREVDHVVPDMLYARERPKGDGPLLSVSHVSKTYKVRESSWLSSSSKPFLALDDVSLKVRRGECLGIVGESGCGKSTLSKLIMRALTADNGDITFHGAKGDIDVMTAKGEALKTYRRCAQFVFQDPFGSLTPRATILNLLMEPLEIHGIGTAQSRRKMAGDLVRMVGLDETVLNRYPHSFSGGQRQRISIARSLALAPELLICDEPVSALDVSVQAQILNLLNALRREIGLTMLFISHNLAVVRYIADRIAVMRKGRIVEIADRDSLFANPIHPYTQALLNAVPNTDPDSPLDFSVPDMEIQDVEMLWEEKYRCWSMPSPDTRLREVSDRHWVLSNA